LPPLPVLTDVWRIANHYTCGEANFVNIWNMQDDGSSPDSSQVAAAFIAAYDQASPSSMRALHSSAVTLGEVEVTPYDGATPTAVFQRAAGVHGTGATPPVAAQVAGILSIQSTRRGPRGRGRHYIGGLPAGLLDADGARWGTSWVTDANSWYGNFETTLLAGSPGLQPVVVSLVHSDFHQELLMTPRRGIGTIKKRAAREFALP